MCRRATVARIAAHAQVIAVGTAAGEVHLLQQHCAASLSASGDGGLTPAASLTPWSSAVNGQTQFDLFASGLHPQQLIRSLNLQDWGHTVKQTGPVAALSWAPDNTAFAVGYGRQGLVVWTLSGCRLLCTLRQPAPETPASATADAVHPFSASASRQVLQPSSTAASEPQAVAGEATGCNGAAADPSTSTSSDGDGSVSNHSALASVDGAVLCIAWGSHGYQLVISVHDLPSSSSASKTSLHWSAAGSSKAGQSNCVLYELSLAKSLRNHHRVTHASAADAGSVVAGTSPLGDELHVLQASACLCSRSPHAPKLTRTASLSLL